MDVEVEPGSILRMVIPVSLEAQDPPILGRWGWGWRKQGYIKAIKIWYFGMVYETGFTTFMIF